MASIHWRTPDLSGAANMNWPPSAVPTRTRVLRRGGRERGRGGREGQGEREGGSGSREREEGSGRQEGESS